ncbi:MAG: glycerol-3-phosphate 1-O-acyltransferase PlsY [Gammaproteobacteria bacterium]|nr:glycerol-3-phosphate 1-O-acyltransferase PlsY [Gammaproteobacteria bacterium]MDD9824590.1 glycerol-3-phosphate 1-O-acyltransferase PlsY [Gammaproteobacteria bacterium]
MIAGISFVLAAYLCGSLTSAILVSRILHLPDPREEGSRNPGASNMLRLHGKRAALLTLAGDVLKGMLPTLAARLAQQPESVIGLCALAAFLGHLYPLFFGLRGGKGVATLGGALVGMHWPLGLVYFGVWLVAAGLSRYASLAAVAAAAAVLFASAALAAARPFFGYNLPMCLLLFWRHRENIRRLLAGREERIRLKKT